jgi:glycosyltransferase involved in cell wall biosynthesis
LLMTKRLRYACEWTSAGIAVAAQRCMKGLLLAGVDLAWEPLVDSNTGRIRTQQSGSAPTWMRALRRPSNPGEVVVLHSVPTAWPDVAADLDASYLIGHSVWELDDLPTRWLTEMASVDEFWVPTEWNRRAFERAFDKPVRVVPHALEDVEAEPPPVSIPVGHRVVGVVAAWDWRKRPDLAIEAFLTAFTAKDDVTLVVKTTPWDVSWPGSPVDPAQIIRNIVSRFSDPANVVVATETWTSAQLHGLHERTDCQLSLTSSEGWGLGAFDAAGRGTPVIITGYGGHVEWLGRDYPGLLPFTMTPTVHAHRLLFEVGTRWARPDFDSAVDLLRGVVDGTATDLIERARSLSHELTEQYSLEAVGALAARSLPSDIRRRIAPMFAQTTAIERPPEPPTVAILTPVKNAARHAERYVDRILSLDYPYEQLSVSLLASDSDDETASVFREQLERLNQVGITTRVFERDFGYHIPAGSERWDPTIQLDRRRVLALSRNHLLFRGLRDEEWALWLDVDVIEYPADIVQRLLSAGRDIVHPNCVDGTGDSFDLNAWTDRGRWHLDVYGGQDIVELHAVGATMLLVNADRHRDGLTWPAYRYGLPNDRIRTDPGALGRTELGEIESEGLAIMAQDMGIACWGLPDIKIRHE